MQQCKEANAEARKRLDGHGYERQGVNGLDGGEWRLR